MGNKRDNVSQKGNKNVTARSKTRLLSVIGYVGTLSGLVAYVYISLLNNQLEARSWLNLVQVWLPVIMIIIIGAIVVNVISAFTEAKWKRIISILCIPINIVVLAILIFTYAFAASV